jgi:peptidoglycan hydrolase-like protein with peptidoglycan-binding domain
MTVSAEAVVRLALAQAGKPYVFGVEVAASDANPNAFDCSELVEWACSRNGVTPTMPDGTWFQQAHCRQHETVIDVEAGIDERGALLFNHRDAAGNPVADMATRPPTAHVAISLGDGTTIEAMGTAWGTRIGSARNRNWTHGARIPGVDYTPQPSSGPAPALGAPRPSATLGGPPWMKLGSTGTEVTELQRVLIEFGVDRLPRHAATGTFTELTDVGVRLVQEHVRHRFDSTMEVDGKCGPITWGWITFLGHAAPNEAPPPGGPPTRPDLPWIDSHSSAAATVAELQKALAAIGIRRLPALSPTGTFGPLTDLAVRLFQLHVKSTHDATMDVDGICGPVTWAYLHELVAHAEKPT